jgi:hypothetical protein
MVWEGNGTTIPRVATAQVSQTSLGELAVNN